MPALPVRAFLTMEKDRERLIEDKKALRDAIKKAMVLEDEEEINRLTKCLSRLENCLRRKK